MRITETYRMSSFKPIRWFFLNTIYPPYVLGVTNSVIPTIGKQTFTKFIKEHVLVRISKPNA